MNSPPVSAFAAYSQKNLKNKQNKAKRKQNKLKSLQLRESTELLNEIIENVAIKAAPKINKTKKQKKTSKNGVLKPIVLKKKRKESKLPEDEVDEAFDSIGSSPQQSPVTQNALKKQTKSQNGFYVEQDPECDSSDDALEDFEPVTSDSSEEGLKIFEWLINPYSSMEFLNKIWEKKPLHIKRENKNYFKDIISTPLIDNMLRKDNIIFTKNIDITSYSDGNRETHNPVGRAHPHIVWDYYLNGCSIRLLNPQTYIPKLHLINATLQEFFNSFVGANAYLTPPDSQGFAPHYDDIEALILQIEGKKNWKIYTPLSEQETLPRFSSKNFDQEEIGEPMMEVTLEAGDMLYFPRGYIHQGVTIAGEHSLHITLSFYQKHSWADLFEKMLPNALQTAITENIQLRKGLPFDLYDNFGLVNSDLSSPRKEEIVNLIKTLFYKIGEHLPIDAAVDEISKEYQHSVLPPVLSDREKMTTVFGDTDVMIENGQVMNRVEIDLDTQVRLLRRNILRMVMEDETIRIYYYVENSLEYHGNDPQYLEIDESLAPAVEMLITTYPEYVSVESLPVQDEGSKVQIANDLWERGLLMTEYPLPTIE